MYFQVVNSFFKSDYFKQQRIFKNSVRNCRERFTNDPPPDRKVPIKLRIGVESKQQKDKYIIQAANARQASIKKELIAVESYGLSIKNIMEIAEIEEKLTKEGNIALA